MVSDQGSTFKSVAETAIRGVVAAAPEEFGPDVAEDPSAVVGGSV